MGLPRTFVGFSSTDIRSYYLMLAWKANDHIDFDFADCQLNTDIDSENEAYIKTKVRQRINLAGKFILLIGDDTRFKHKYVRWEVEIAIEKRCTIIGVNLDKSRSITDKAPGIIRGIGAIFVPFSPRIVAHAIENWSMRSDGQDYHYLPQVYASLGL